MLLMPLKRTPQKNVALLTPGNRELMVQTKHGETLFRGKRRVESALMKLGQDDFVCFVTSSIERMKHTTGATSWMMNTWHGRETSMIHAASEVKVMSLRGTLDDSGTPFEDLSRFLSWAYEFGVPAGGLSKMSWDMMRASLSSSQSFGFDPEIGAESFFGGRQGITRPGSFFDQRLIDKVAAYPTAMADRPVAMALFEVDKATELDPATSGLARAIVVVPQELKYPPLPVRVGSDVIQFRWGALSGVWTWVELDLAKKLGCEVIVEKCWAPAREFPLFENWWQMAQTGRELVGGAARLSKATSNCLWGQFAMTGSGAGEVHWASDKGDEPYSIAKPDRSLPHEWGRHIAAEVTSRVRTELLTAIVETNSEVTHIDTDGIIIDKTAKLPKNMGSQFGQFREKQDMVELEVHAPQFYRFKTPASRLWQYVSSGVNQRQAEWLFLHKSKVATTISYLATPDAVLPDGSSFDWNKNEQLAKEVRYLR